jgi:hypothetical protein
MDSDTVRLDKKPEALVPVRGSPPVALISLVFTLAVFLSAALLFIVEPMFGKMVLPLLGGTPAVWTTCMLFFQGALLLGYLYAHVGPRWLGARRHTAVHVALLAIGLLVLPVQVAEVSGAFRLEHPTVWLLWVLTLSLAIPFVLLSSTGPLLQVWFSNTQHPDAHNPYFLYAASNAGSLLGLLSYPFLIEPELPLRAQSWYWTLGYLLLLVLVTVSAVYQKKPVPRETNSFGERVLHPPTPRGTLFRWTFLAFVPSSFFLALTTYVTTDIAAVPLLWVVPLVLYLLSFTIVFGRRTFPWAALLPWQAIGLIALAIVDFWGASNSAPWLLPLHLIVFFVTALVCHGELAATRPAASRLTEFYLCIAVGGVLGGIFNAVIAPAFFDSVLEYPLTLLLACAIRPGATIPPRRRLAWDLGLASLGGAVLVASRGGLNDHPVLGFALIASIFLALLCLRMSRNPVRFAIGLGAIVAAGIADKASLRGILMKERNFFGVREVRYDSRLGMHLLMHGTTKHGAQSTDPARRREPTSYYYRQGPLGEIFSTLPSLPGRKVAVLGLGAGGLAAYGRPGEHWTYFEIDPDIARVARDTNYFTYLHDTPARLDVILGDGRLLMDKEPDHAFDLIIADAFSSDAIPVHLLTVEAFSMYLSKLAPGGMVLFHLSNRYLNLEPVLARMIEATGVSGLIRVNTGVSQAVLKSGGDPSIWSAVAPQPEALTGLRNTPGWRALRIQQEVGLWTDDFSNIFRVFHLPTKAWRDVMGTEKKELPKAGR